MLAALAPIALGLTLAGQVITPYAGQDFNDEKVAPDDLPAAVRQVAAREARGARVAQAYRVEREVYKVILQKDAKTTVVLKVTADGDLMVADTRTRVDPKDVPAPVADALKRPDGRGQPAPRAKTKGRGRPGGPNQVEREQLAGFEPETAEKVAHRAPLGGDDRKAGLYEFVGRNGQNLRVRVGVNDSGKVLFVDNILRNPEEGRAEQGAADVPAEVRQGFLQAFADLPGVRVTGATRQAAAGDNNEGGEPSGGYTVSGSAGRGRRLRAAVEPNGQVLWAAAEVTSKEVPRPVLNLLRQQIKADATLKGFEPKVAMRVQNHALGGTAYAFVGKGTGGEAKEILIEDSGEVRVRAPSDLVPPEGGPKPAGDEKARRD